MNKVSAAIAALALAGCVSNDTPVDSKPTTATRAEQNLVSAAVSENLKDPSSAQFRKWQAFQLSNGQRVICAELNGKNSFGAYVGFQAVYARLEGKQIIKSHTGDYAQLACNQARQNTLKIASALG